MVVHGGGIDVHIGMLGFHLGDAFGRADQVEAADLSAAVLFEQVYGCDDGAARGQHGVKDDGQALVQVAGQLHIVFHGFQGAFVAVHAHHADARAGDHIQYAVHQAQTRPQDGHHRDLFAGDGFHVHRSGPALHGEGFRQHVFGGFVNEQTGHFVGNGAKFVGGGGRLPQDAQLVAHQRVVNNMHSHESAPANKDKHLFYKGKIEKA